VLLIEPGQLGDTIHLLPALWDLRRNFPQAELHVVSSPVGADLLRLAGCVDRQWVLDQAPERRSLAKQFRVLLALRRLRFDLSINFGDNDRNVIHAAFAGARRRVGLRRDRWHFWSRWCIPEWIAVGNRDEPVFEQRRQMLAACGFDLGPPRFDLRVPQSAEDWAAANVPSGAIHFSINASTHLKEWPLPHWIELAQRLGRGRPGARIVATGTASPREVKRLETFAASLTGMPVKTFSGPTITQLAALLRRCALHIGADSGVLHLAMALGTPTFSVFREYPGQLEWVPRGPPHRHLKVACGCAGQRRPACLDLDQSVCMAALSPQTVANALEEETA
jgi:ADP-heptose:LPS heptosyltransferase